MAEATNKIECPEPPVGNRKKVYKVNDIMIMLDISKNKAYELCKSGLFEVRWVGRAIRISKESFDRWFEG